MNKHINNTGITINIAKDLKDKSLKYKNFINSGTGIVKKVTIIIGKKYFFHIPPNAKAYLSYAKIESYYTRYDRNSNNNKKR